MIVTMFWHGGSSYEVFDTHSARDAEQFESLNAAKRAFSARTCGRDSYYPCVSDCLPEDGGPEAWIFKGPAAGNIGAEYPDFTMNFGPRGGVRVCPA